MKKCILLLMLLTLLPFSLADSPADAPAPQIVLKENLSTGYSWQWTVESHGGGIAVDSRSVPDASAADESGIIPPGTGGRFELTLTGCEPGEVTLTCTYQRVWEDAAPLYTLVYRVRAEEDGSVTLLSCDFGWD